MWGFKGRGVGAGGGRRVTPGGLTVWITSVFGERVRGVGIPETAGVMAVTCYEAFTSG